MDNQKNSSQPSEETPLHSKQEEKVEDRIGFMKKILNMGKFGTLGLMLLAIPVSMYLLSQRQDIQQRASGRDVPVLTTPTPTPGSTLSTNPPCDNLGDVNLDGKVTSEDVESIRYIMRGRSNYTDAQKKNGDVNADGQTNEADIALVTAYVTAGTVFPECLPPSAPSNLAVTNTTTNSMTLTWTNTSTKGTKIQVDSQVWQDPPLPVDSQWSGFIADIAANSTSYVSTGLYPYANWNKFRVRTCNNRGCSQWSNQVVVPPIIKAPTNLKATLSKGPDVWGWSPEGNYHVELTWTNNATNATRTYGYIQQAGASGNGSRQGEYVASSTSATWNYGISDNRYNNRQDYTGKTFIYWMVACNNDGCSSASNPVSVTFK